MKDVLFKTTLTLKIIGGNMYPVELEIIHMIGSNTSGHHVSQTKPEQHHIPVFSKVVLQTNPGKIVYGLIDVFPILFDARGLRPDMLRFAAFCVMTFTLGQ